jgi:hypothetical protein
LREKVQPRGKFWYLGRFVAWDIKLVLARLGKASDRSLAKEIAAPQHFVRNVRLRLDIPAFDKLGALVPLLGRVPDRVLSIEHGVSRQAIRNRRRKLGIEVAPLRKHRAVEMLHEYALALTTEDE